LILDSSPWFNPAGLALGSVGRSGCSGMAGTSGTYGIGATGSVGAQGVGGTVSNFDINVSTFQGLSEESTLTYANGNVLCSDVIGNAVWSSPQSNKRISNYYNAADVFSNKI
jgi:hypothetical protein